VSVAEAIGVAEIALVFRSPDSYVPALAPPRIGTIRVAGMRAVVMG